MKTPKGFMRLSDVPKHLGTSRTTVYRLIKAGKLVAWRPGYVAYVPLREVNKFLGIK